MMYIHNLYHLYIRLTRFTRYSFTSKRLCRYQASVHPPPPASPKLTQYDCTTIALCTTPPRPPFCRAYTIQGW